MVIYDLHDSALEANFPENKSIINQTVLFHKAILQM